MTQKPFQAFVLAMTILAGSAMAAAAAPKTQRISIDVFPYVASLGQNAAQIEQDLTEQAVKVCGSLENVSYLDEVNLKMVPSRATQINANGVPGGVEGNQIFSFAYPRVAGSAKVICKK